MSGARLCPEIERMAVTARRSRSLGQSFTSVNEDVNFSLLQKQLQQQQRRTLTTTAPTVLRPSFLDARTSYGGLTGMQILTPQTVVRVSDIALNGTTRRGMVMVSQHKADEIPAAPKQQQQTNPSADEAERPAVVVTTTSSSGASDQPKLHVTPSCWNRIKLLAKRKEKSLDEVYLRVYVDAGGCSGFTYKFQLVDDMSDEPIDENEDVVFVDPSPSGDASGPAARVVVDESSLELIQGSKIDYVQEMIKSAFEVRDNPQSESACGCGSSFAVKNFAANPAKD